MTVAVIVNIFFSLVSIGYLIYKVRVLEEHVFQCKSDSLREYQPESGEYRDETYRGKRSVLLDPSDDRKAVAVATMLVSSYLNWEPLQR